jgi:hypothetical protein
LDITFPPNQTDLPRKHLCDGIIQLDDIIVLWGEDATLHQCLRDTAGCVMLQVSKDLPDQVRWCLPWHQHIVRDAEGTTRVSTQTLPDCQKVVCEALLLVSTLRAERPEEALDSHVYGELEDTHMAPDL